MSSFGAPKDLTIMEIILYLEGRHRVAQNVWIAHFRIRAVKSRDVLRGGGKLCEKDG